MTNLYTKWYVGNDNVFSFVDIDTMTFLVYTPIVVLVSGLSTVDFGIHSVNVHSPTAQISHLDFSFLHVIRCHFSDGPSRSLRFAIILDRKRI